MAAPLSEVTVRISPKMKIEDENWRWHLGLDSEATSILNDLYDGSDVAEDGCNAFSACSSLSLMRRSRPIIAVSRSIWGWR